MSFAAKASKALTAMVCIIVALVMLPVQPSARGAPVGPDPFVTSITEPVGIAGGFRTNPDPTKSDLQRFRVTNPLCNSSTRYVREIDPTGSVGLIATILNGRPATGCARDSVITFPSVLGASLTAGGWTENTTLVALGNKIFLLGTGCSGANPCTRDATLDSDALGYFAKIPASQCSTSGHAFTALVHDQRNALFAGHVIVTCFDGARFEAWRLKSDGTFSGATPFKSFTNWVISGRPAIAPPNFGLGIARPLGGRLLVYREDTRQLLAIDDTGAVEIIAVTALPANAGRGSVKAIPVLYPFDVSGGGLFATVPASNEILEYLATLFPFAGDVLVVTVNGLMARVTEEPLTSGFASSLIDAGDLGGRTLEDQDWAPRGRALIIVQQPAYNSNPNTGVQGQIVGYLCDGTNWDPITQVDRTTLRFGRTGSEPSIVKFSNANTNACGGPGADLKFFADPAIANCDAPAVCILTGFTNNPEGFEAP